MRVIVWGADGQMGSLVCQAVIDAGHELVGRVTASSQELAPADVIVDFSTPACTSALLSYALQQKLPLVIATTGHTLEQQAAITEASEIIPVLQAANFSLGMNLLLSLVEEVARVLSDSDIEIVETHHRYKQDAPSGSAKALLAALEKTRGTIHPVYGRAGVGLRGRDEIGVHARRGGNVVGEHTVSFFTAAETLSLTHTAHDRTVFATGAIRAAEFLYLQAPGFYTLRHLINV